MRRLSEIHISLADLERMANDEKKAKKALALFDRAWDVLEPRERERLVRIVIDRVNYNGIGGTVDVTYHALGFSISGPGAQVQEDTPTGYRKILPHAADHVA